MNPQNLQKIYEAIDVSANIEQMSTATGLDAEVVQAGIDLLLSKNLIQVANAADLRYKTK